MNNDLQNQINDLKQRIKELEKNQISLFMPYNTADIIRNTIVLKKQTRGAEALSDFLIVTWKDKTYKIPFYV